MASKMLVDSCSSSRKRVRSIPCDAVGVLQHQTEKPHCATAAETCSVASHIQPDRLWSRPVIRDTIDNLPLAKYLSVHKILAQQLPQGAVVCRSDMQAIVAQVRLLNTSVRAWKSADETAMEATSHDLDVVCNQLLSEIRESIARIDDIVQRIISSLGSNDYRNIDSNNSSHDSQPNLSCSEGRHLAGYDDSEAIHRFGVRDHYRRMALDHQADAFSDLVEVFLSEHDREMDQSRIRSCSFEVAGDESYPDLESPLSGPGPSVYVFCDWVVRTYVRLHRDASSLNACLGPPSTFTLAMADVAPISLNTCRLLDEFVQFVGGFAHRKPRQLAANAADWIDRHFRKHTLAASLVRWQVHSTSLEADLDRLIVTEFGSRAGLAQFLQEMDNAGVGCASHIIDPALSIPFPSSSPPSSAYSLTYRHREMGIVAATLPAMFNDSLVRTARHVGRADWVTIW
ncbi:hypothetical protein BASA81_018564 [Batrachochytrium salamandrivorans]|nr:hypothetical protein BASA81_018564 [Batrachochytrium salamandrivorans]